MNNTRYKPREWTIQDMNLKDEPTLFNIKLLNIMYNTKTS